MTYDDLIRYVDRSVRDELELDPDGDPVFWAAIAVVAFYTDAWRSGPDGAFSLVDVVGVAITDAFVLEVLAEQCSDAGDFEGWRAKHPVLP